MHPELERMAEYYLSARRAVAEGRATPEEAINAVKAANVTDGAGRVWRISPTSPPDRALFTVEEAGQARLADPSEFAAAPAGPHAAQPSPYGDVPPAPQVPAPHHGAIPGPYAASDPHGAMPYPTPGFGDVPPAPIPQTPPAPVEYGHEMAYGQPHHVDPAAELHGYPPAVDDHVEPRRRRSSKPAQESSGVSVDIVERLRALPRPAQIAGVVVLVAVLALLLRPLYTSGGSEAPETTIPAEMTVTPDTQGTLMPAPTPPEVPGG